MNAKSPEYANLIKQSAELRATGDNAGAITLIESKLPSIDSAGLLDAYLECFYAAVETDSKDKALEYAKKIHAIDPKIPTVETYLDM